MEDRDRMRGGLVFFFCLFVCLFFKVLCLLMVLSGKGRLGFGFKNLSGGQIPLLMVMRRNDFQPSTVF